EATLYKLPELHRLLANLKNAGLDAFLADLALRQLDADQAVRVFDHSWFASIVSYLSFTNPGIGAFDGTTPTRSGPAFSDADRAHINSSPARVRRAVAEHATRARDEHTEQSDVVEREARKQRRHLPVRELFQIAPDVMTALKPCWAMSPLVV